MAMTPANTALAVLTAAEVPNWYSGLMPSTFTIATFSDDPAKVKQLRRAELVASGLSIGAGIAVSQISGSYLALWLVLIVMAVLIYEYERAIRRPINGGTDMRSY